MTWDRFIAQYEAQGREKGDGYLPSYFAGMTAEELATARAMMLRRALGGDSVDLDGLRYIGDADTVTALDAARSGSPAQEWSFDIVRLNVLYVLTDDQIYLAALSRYLDGGEADAQSRAAYVLASHVLPHEADEFLLQRLADGRHEPAFNGLMSAWIGLHERRRCDAMCFQRHLALIRRVSNAAPQDRPALLAEAAPGLAPAAG